MSFKICTIGGKVIVITHSLTENNLKILFTGTYHKQYVIDEKYNQLLMKVYLFKIYTFISNFFLNQ